MADFTTWTALLTAIRNALAQRDLAVSEYRTPDGQWVRFRSFEELQQLEGWVSQKAAAETATSGTPRRRAYVRPQGSGW